MLRQRKLTLAVAESCTGGLIAHRITNVSGASQVFLAGLVTYSNKAKQAFLGVRPATLAEHGAVSEETAREMAAGALREAGADHALSVTGIAGPTGGTPDKPVGTVFIGLASKSSKALAMKFLNPYDRETFNGDSGRVVSIGKQELTAEIDGRLQTYSPEHPVIRAILSGDEEGFWRAEAEERRVTGMPPFGRLAGIVVSAPEAAAAFDLGTHLSRSDGPIRAIGGMVYGPAPAPIARIRGRHRVRLLVKAPKGAPIQGALRQWLGGLKLPGGLRLSVDIDPQSFY